jgi:hypothetical protein
MFIDILFQCTLISRPITFFAMVVVVEEVAP